MLGDSSLLCIEWIWNSLPAATHLQRVRALVNSGRFIYSINGSPNSNPNPYLINTLTLTLTLALALKLNPSPNM